MPLPRLTFSNGQLEILKWSALVIMTLDHVNKYFFKDALAVVFDIGRVAMPIFFFILAYNLARPGAMEKGVYQRVIKRLAISGMLASIPYIALGGLAVGWWPLNIMFTLLVITITIYLIESEHFILAQVVFFLGGSVVEYWWFASAFGIAVWSYYKKPSWIAFSLAILACASLFIINRNNWALLALPLLFLASRINFNVPKKRLIFYAYYPLHLAVIWLVIFLKSKNFS